MLNLRSFFGIWSLLLIFTVSVIAAESDLDPTFSTGNGIDNTLIAAALQADGKIIVGGNFDVVGGVRRSRIARLNADGSLDTTFTRGNGVDGNGIVWVVGSQNDGKVFVGGEFSSVNGTARANLARLNNDGSLDTTFTAQVSDRVLQLAVQPDGKILIGGDFQTVNGSFTAGRFTRLNADGSLDTSFSYNAAQNLIPASIYLQPDGKILLAGNNRILRLNPDGSLDNFNGSGLGGFPYFISYNAADGSILVGGSITSYNGVARSNLIRLLPNGDLSTAFNPQFSGTISGGAVNDAQFLADGKIVIAGFFETVNGTPRNGFAILNSDGTLDTSFNPAVPFAGAVRNILRQPDGKFIVGGQFTTIAGLARNRIARFNADKTIDTSFSKMRGANATVASLLPLADGKILIGGEFTGVEEKTVGGIARLTSNGSLDPTFNSGGSGTDGVVGKIARQSDGKFIIGGFFTSYNGTPRKNVARLNPDGSLDTTFNTGSNFDALIADLEIQPDGKIIVVGFFNNVGGATGKNIARLNSDGSLDSSFNVGAGADFEIYDVELRTNGQILIGGNFDNFNGSPRSSVALINANGSLTTFNPNTVFDNAVLSVATQSDGRVVVGGAFNNVNGVARNKVARLNSDGSVDSSFTLGGGFTSGEVFKVLIQPDGKILASGTFLSLANANRPIIARLTANGVVETAFNVGPVSGGTNGQTEVDDIALQNDGKILFAGDFTVVNSVQVNRVARLIGSFVAPLRVAPFDFDGDGKADISVFRSTDRVWYLLDSTTGFQGFQFGSATDKIVPADYDGDGKTDIAVFRDGTWYLLRSQAGFSAVQWGNAGDIPLRIRFRRRPQRRFRRLSATAIGIVLKSLRAAPCKRRIGEFGGRYSRCRRFRSATEKPITAFTATVFGLFCAPRRRFSNRRFQWGIAGGDKPVPADYDGDGKTDLGVFRNGTWYLLRSQLGAQNFNWGNADDIPTAADYDGDGKTDFGVFRNGIWYLQRSTAGVQITNFGLTGDKPLAASYLP